MFKKIIGIILFMMLAACQAQEVEFKITDKKLDKALRGREEAIEFTAVIERYGRINDEVEYQIQQIEEILDRYMKIDDFDVDTRRNRLKITIEGEIPLIYGQRFADAPWYFAIEDNREARIDYAYLLELKTGKNFRQLQAELRNIDRDLQIAAFHPTRLNIRGNRLDMFAVSSQIGGRYYRIFETSLSQRLSLEQSGGLYNQVGPGFYFNHNR